jgi:AraC family transcriptional regulator
MTELYIKNMVCKCCIRVVQIELEKSGLSPSYIELGKVRIRGKLSEEAKKDLDMRLQKYDLEILRDKRTVIVEKVKSFVIANIKNPEKLDRKIAWSNMILGQLDEVLSYERMSKLFSSVTGTTLESFIMRQKIERVKELVFQDELNFMEISKKMGFASLPHLSFRFKKVTGVTLSDFKASAKKKR